LCDKFPRLFSYVLNEDMSVAEMSLVRDLRSCFSLPLLVEAYAEFQEVSQLIVDHPTTMTAPDQRVFVWGIQVYCFQILQLFICTTTARTLPSMLFGDPDLYLNCEFFLGVLMHDRLNTRELMIRKNWHLDSRPSCVLCDEASIESNNHLFFDCHFAKQCWEKLSI
jgi:hypothetical protein